MVLVRLIIGCVLIRCVKKVIMKVTNELDAITNQLTQAAIPYQPYSQADANTIELFINKMMQERPTPFSPQQLVAFTHNYATHLGSGGFGVVYKGELPNGVQLAVKVLDRSSYEIVKEQFMAEVSTIGRTYHINLVRLYGYCFDTSVRALVYEYMENGSLDGFLFSKDRRIELEKLHGIAIGTAKGIAYLHEECEQRIIHIDIKPENVLLDANFNPKVADFGLAKLCDRDNSNGVMTGGRGTPGYAAPELYMPFPVTFKCDVYSFGIMLFEIVGRRRHHNVNQTENRAWFPRWVWDKYSNGNLESITIDCEIEETNREKAERMCMVALWCVQRLPEARPPMSRVVMMLEGAEIVAPPNPFQHLISSPVADLEECSASSAYSAATWETAEIAHKDFDSNNQKI